MEKKVCAKCKEEKELIDFESKKKTCKECRKKLRREYYQNNKDKEKQNKKEYYQNNKDKIKQNKKEYYQNNKENRINYQKEYIGNNKDKIKQNKKEYYQNNKDKIKQYKKEYSKKYYKKNREKIIQYNIKRKKNLLPDPIFKLHKNISNGIRRNLKIVGCNKNSKTQRILGCTYDEFKLHIESQWEEGMNWDNYGKYNGEEKYGWDYDHIIPISSGKCEEDIIRLNHHSNIQPLCSYINRCIKKDKIEKRDTKRF
jgi:hypothetical protein